jgi:2'-5' RNA ligase
VAEDRVTQVEEALTRVATATGKIDLSVEGFGAFPTIRNPNVIWVGVEPTPSLRCLKQDLEWALKDCGFDREGRAFHPHLTLGKVDVSSRAGEFRGLDEAAAGLTYKGEMKIRKMDLMRSQVVKGGPTYSLRHRSAFAG